MLQCVAECCSVLQCVAVCCSVLQCVAVWWIGFVPVILQRDNRAHRIVTPLAKIHQSGAEWFSVLQHVAVCCSVVQCVAAWCSVLQGVILEIQL